MIFILVHEISYDILPIKQFCLPNKKIDKTNFNLSTKYTII